MNGVNKRLTEPYADTRLSSFRNGMRLNIKQALTGNEKKIMLVLVYPTPSKVKTIHNGGVSLFCRIGLSCLKNGQKRKIYEKLDLKRFSWFIYDQRNEIPHLLVEAT
jgi:hypothetical protein